MHPRHYRNERNNPINTVLHFAVKQTNKRQKTEIASQPSLSTLERLWRCVDSDRTPVSMYHEHSANQQHLLAYCPADAKREKRVKKETPK